MATQVRTPAVVLDPKRLTRDLLEKELRSVAQTPSGAALFEALKLALEQRARLRDQPAVPWTLEAAIEALDASKTDIELFASLRLLQGAQPDRARLGYSLVAQEDPARIDQELRGDFAPGEVAAVAEDRGIATSGRPVVTQDAIGFVGPNGALPYTWTELAQELRSAPHRAQRDGSFAAFLNVIQRRHLAFIYRAWNDTEAIAGADRPGEPHPMADRLRALAGLALGESDTRDTVPAAFKSAFAALFSRRARSPLALAAMLSRFFDAKVDVEEFVAHWLPIPREQRTQLGVRFTTLGGDAVAGNAVWDCSSRFRIRVRALTLERYYTFLPQGHAHAQLRDLVALYAGPEFDWELVPELRAGEVPRSALGHPWLLVGWSSWLGVRSRPEDAADLALPMSPRLEARHAPAVS